MSDFSLGKEFPQAEWDEWKNLVEKTLGGADFEKKLVSSTYDNIKIQPLYTAENTPENGSDLPGTAPFTRGTSESPRALFWHIAQSFSQPDPGIANKNILTELKNGVTALVLRLDDDANSERTITISNLDDFEQLLFGVHIDMLPLHLDAGDRGPAAASLAIAHARKSGAPLEKCEITFGIDPLGEFARRGIINENIDQAFALMSDIASWSTENLPLGRSILSDTRHYHSAGASSAQELACALSTGLEYLRALEKHGLALSQAATQITFFMAADADFFGTIAKFRSLRRLWATITASCGIDPSPAKLMAQTASRMMSALDPGVNMLRTTVASFAAGAAGADSITVEPYTTKHGLPDEHARRIARNTQVILQEEAGVARVLDPAGGSYFVENLTNDLCEKAWEIFQDIEAKGGMFASLKSGHVQQMIASLHEKRRADIAKRKTPITGVSEFPDIHEGKVKTEPLSSGRTAQTGHASGPLALPEPLNGAFAAMIQAAENGASIAELTAAFAGGGETCEALPVISLAEDYEALRAASDAFTIKTGARPKIFLCNLGKVSAFTGRATFAKNFFEAGGIEAISNNGFETAADAAKAFSASGAEIAILCSSDTVYETLGLETVKALGDSNVKAVYLAGHPGEAKQAYEAAGTRDFIYVGCNVLSVLQDAQSVLGVEK